MKHSIISLLFILFTQPLLANPELKALMKTIGGDFKLIVAAAQSGKVTSQELSASEEILLKAQEAQKIYPDTATDENLKHQYDDLMIRFLNSANLLKEKINLEISQANQDIQGLFNILQELVEIRNEGHDLFKLED